MQFYTTIVNVSLTACTDKEEEDITTIGGKSFKRIAVHPRSNITPGVRCSKRRRIVPIQPGQYLEYKIHKSVALERLLVNHTVSAYHVV